MSCSATERGAPSGWPGRSGKRLAGAARRGGEPAEAKRRVAYQRRRRVTEASLQQAAVVAARLAEAAGAKASQLQRELARCVPLVQQVVTQTRRRVLAGAS